LTLQALLLAAVVRRRGRVQRPDEAAGHFCYNSEGTMARARGCFLLPASCCLLLACLLAAAAAATGVGVSAAALIFTA
jgi:hypothetical protein